MTALTETATYVVETLAANMTDRKLNANDIDDNLRSAAGEYVYSYTGNFSYMLDLHRRCVGNGEQLTDAQAAGALNCAIAEYRYQKRTAVAQAEQIVSSTPAAAPATTQVVLDGYYTIVGPKGGHRTLRLQTVDDTSPRQWLAYLCGQDNTGDYKSVGFVNGSQVSTFNKYAGQYQDIIAAAKFLVRNADKIDEYGRQYAVRSGKCYVCNRKLTTPESVRDGIGPICASKR